MEKTSMKIEKTFTYSIYCFNERLLSHSPLIICHYLQFFRLLSHFKMSPTPFIPDIYMEEESDDYSEDSDGSNESDAILVVLPLPPVRPFLPTLLDCWMAEVNLYPIISRLLPLVFQIRDFDFIWCLQAFVVYLSVSWLLNLLAGTYRPPNSEYFVS